MIKTHPESGRWPATEIAAHILAGGSFNLARLTLRASPAGALVVSDERGRSSTFATVKQFQAALTTETPGQPRRPGISSTPAAAGSSRGSAETAAPEPAGPLDVARAAGREAGQAAPPLSTAQERRVRTLLRHASPAGQPAEQ